jgi:FHA domain-containing protein
VSTRIVDMSRDWHDRIRRFFDAPLDRRSHPLEISQAVLAHLESKVQAVGRGRRVFPYDEVVVHVAGVDADRAALDAAFAGASDQLRERLRELQCEMSTPVQTRLIVSEAAPPDWPDGRVFAVECRMSAPVAARVRATAAMTLKVDVIRGAATERTYAFTDPIVAIGRTEDPTDELGRVRRNRIVFVDAADGVTETVGRAHARIRFDPDLCEFRIYDDGSSNGTAIVRGGDTITVPRRDPRGVRLAAGDEVHVGRAVLRVSFDPGEREV